MKTASPWLSNAYSKVQTLPENPFQLRGYQPGDLDAMFALDVLCFQPPFRFSRAAMRRFTEVRNARVVVAEIDGELAGFCIVHIERYEEQRVGYIVTLDVDPRRRREGLGRLLMTKAEAEGRDAMCGSLALHVFADNAGAIRFYETLGYERSHRAADFYGKGVDAWVYRKRLELGAADGGGEWRRFAGREAS